MIYVYDHRVKKELAVTIVQNIIVIFIIANGRHVNPDSYTATQIHATCFLQSNPFLI